jgi:hypothetical protein
MAALSRRFSKLLPLQVASSFARVSSSRTGTGCSGTEGAVIRAIGDRVVSLSSVSHLNNR